MLKSINLPFMGFYNSLLDSEVDACIEDAAEYQTPEGRLIPDEEYKHILFNKADFGVCHKEIARKYVDAFNEYMAEEFGVDLCLSFDALVSPREYNFTTDRIFAFVPEEKVDELVRIVDRRKLGETINARLASRSGFISHYSDFVRDWDSKPVEDWDSNELSMLLYSLVDGVEDFDLILYESIRDSVYVAFQNCVDWGAVGEAVDAYLEENEEDEEEVDARQFPAGNLPADQYVDAFCRLNNLTK